MVIILEVCYGYYVRSVLRILSYKRVMVIMLVAGYGYYVRSVLWLLYW